MSRRVRRSTETTKTKTGYTTQRDGEFTSRRSARGGDNFLKLSSEKNKDPYCVSYFKNNPGSMDMRTPSEKLQELNDRLDAEMRGDINLVPSEKFKTLTQIKSITFMINGESSSEMVKAYANLGYFYNDNNRPQSAVRNFEKAHNLERTNPVDKEISINIAVETAKAQLSIKTNHGAVSSKQVTLADEALSPYYDTEIEKVQLRHKRDLIRSRIFAAQKKYDEAIRSYELSVKSLKEMNDNYETEAEANIFIEMAQVAEKKHKKLLSSHSKTQTQQTQNQEQEQTQTQTQTQLNDQSESSEEIPPISREAGLFYKRAYDIFTKLGMEEEAKNIEPLLLSDEYSEYYYEEEEEEEEEATDTPLSQEDENNRFAPREPTDENGSRNSSRRRQFREKASENSQDGNLEKQQNGIANGLLNNNEEEQAAEEENIENNEEENNEINANNEEENVAENNDEEEENKNKEEEEKADDAVLEKQNNDLVSGLVGGDEEKKTDENA